MSFSQQKKNRIKRRYGNVKSLTSTTVYSEVGKKSNLLKLEIEGSFKMFTISYQGHIDRIIKKRFTKIKIKHNSRSKKILVLNPHKVKLKNNILFSYIGEITLLKKAMVYGWGEIQQPANKVIPSNTVDNINLDQNLVDSHSTTLR